VMTWA